MAAAVGYRSYRLPDTANAPGLDRRMCAAAARPADALASGFDFRRHPNILVSDAVPLPRDIYAGTRGLLAPSVGVDAAGRRLGPGRQFFESTSTKPSLDPPP
jgi:hypothetical protein